VVKLQSFGHEQLVPLKKTSMERKLLGVHDYDYMIRWLIASFGVHRWVQVVLWSIFNSEESDTLDNLGTHKPLASML